MIEQKIKTANANTTADFPLTKKVEPRIVFMGTPEFAVASLSKLVEAHCNIVGVITAPDKTAGRGLQLQQSAVKKYAIEHGLNILQPEKLKDPFFLDELKALKADLQIVVAFRMLPEIVWNMPAMGTVNLHGSLLPQYRGAAPINWAIINGETKTGVTTFKLQHAIDTGDILLQTTIQIGEEETAGELHDKMKEIGAQLLLETVNSLIEGTLNEKPQVTFETTDQHNTNEGEAMLSNQQAVLKHAPKIFTETCQIDFSKTVSDVYNLVRGLSPYPAAFTFLEGRKLKIFKAEKVHPGQQENSSVPLYKAPQIDAGSFETDKKKFLRFACSDGFIAVKELQLEGKKKITVEDFVRGYRFK